ncbi:MAG: hypothetical protein ACQEQC_03915 [Elusimicrobiota bacterium]
MEGFNKLKINIEELIRQYKKLNRENNELRREIKRMQKDLSFYEDQNKSLPEISQKNKKLRDQKEQIEDKVDNMLNRLEEINI